MRIGTTRYAVEWGQLLLVVFIGVVIIAYLFDARAVSLKTNNLLLIEPASIYGIVLVAFVLPRCFKRLDLVPAGEPATRDPSRIELGRFLAIAGALLLFVFGFDYIGVDVAAWAFTTVGLYICGERKAWVLAVFPIVFTVLIVLAFKSVTPFPLPTLLL